MVYVVCLSHFQSYRPPFSLYQSRKRCDTLREKYREILLFRLPQLATGIAYLTPTKLATAWNHLFHQEHFPAQPGNIPAKTSRFDGQFAHDMGMPLRLCFRQIVPVGTLLTINTCRNVLQGGS